MTELSIWHVLIVLAGVILPPSLCVWVIMRNTWAGVVLTIAFIAMFMFYRGA